MKCLLKEKNVGFNIRSKESEIQVSLKEARGSNFLKEARF
jgi:hypothetical protein